MSMDSRSMPRPKTYIESSPTTRPRPGGLAVYDLGLSSRVPGFESRPGRSVDALCFVPGTGRYLYLGRVSAADERGPAAASVVPHCGDARWREPGADHRGAPIPALQRASAQRGPRPRLPDRAAPP